MLIYILVRECSWVVLALSWCQASDAASEHRSEGMPNEETSELASLENFKNFN